MGILKLYPAAHSIQRIKDDYGQMKSMIYGHYPTFDEVLEGIRMLEEEINTIKSFRR